MPYLHETPEIAAGIDHLTRNDPVFSKLPAYQGDMWPRLAPGFPGLARIVLGQQVSIRAANALWVKFSSLLDPVAPSGYLGLENESLRGAGLSRQKILYLTGLAESMESRTFDPARFDAMDDEAVTKEITALKGFGPWSAQMYLMFALARPNVWSPADLGIQEGLRKYLNADTRPGIVETAAYKERFTPHCTAASLLLWYLNDQKSGTG